MATDGSALLQGQILLTECQICLMSMDGRSPRALSCVHTFCESCLLRLVGKSKKKKLACPTCRHVTNLSSGGIAKLPINFMVAQLAEDLNRAALCQNCTENYRRTRTADHVCNTCHKYLCESCKDRHDVIPHFQRHDVAEISKQTQEKTNLCDAHGRPYELFCRKCSETLCDSCALSQAHHGHENYFQTLGTEVDRLSENLHHIIVSLRNTSVSNLQRNFTEFSKVEKVREEIRNESNIRRQLISREELRLTEELEVQYLIPLLNERDKINYIIDKVNNISVFDETGDREKVSAEKIKQLAKIEKRGLELLTMSEDLKSRQSCELLFEKSDRVDELGEVKAIPIVVTEEEKPEVKEEEEMSDTCRCHDDSLAPKEQMFVSEVTKKIPIEVETTATEPPNTSPDWCHGEMDVEEAETYLRARGKDGTFFIWRNRSEPSDVVLSVLTDSTVKHVKIYYLDGKYAIRKGEEFISLKDLVRYYKENCIVEATGSLIRPETPLSIENLTQADETEA